MITPSLGKKKKNPPGLCKISSVLTVPLSLLLCGAAWLINTLGSFQDPLLSPLQGEPRASQPDAPSGAEDAPAHPDGQSLLHTTLGEDKPSQAEVEASCRLPWTAAREEEEGHTLCWHKRPPSNEGCVAEDSLDSPRGKR